MADCDEAGMGADGVAVETNNLTELMTAARLKDEFVATVSHELRTPLTSIVGYVDLLLEDVEGVKPDARAFLEIVQRNARRLHRLVDDLLSDALKLGRAELHLDRISLAAVVRASAVEAEKSARNAGLATVEAAWVAAHAWEHGFVVRYTPENTATTGYQPEAWHLRYVGPELAAWMHANGVGSLEEALGVSGGPDYAAG